jgi:hypothetical protein
MRFHRSPIVTGLMVATLFAGALTGGVGASAAIEEPWPEAGALFGAYVEVDSHTGRTREAAWANFESMSGRQMDVDRQFKKWDEPCVNASDRASAAAGRRLLISWTAKRRNGSYESWSRIASGALDPLIDACATALAGLGSTVEFTFQHEPETNTGPLPGPLPTTRPRTDTWWTACAPSSPTCSTCPSSWRSRPGRRRCPPGTPATPGLMPSGSTATTGTGA